MDNFVKVPRGNDDESTTEISTTKKTNKKTTKYDEACLSLQKSSGTTALMLPSGNIKPLRNQHAGGGDGIVCFGIFSVKNQINHNCFWIFSNLRKINVMLVQ